MNERTLIVLVQSTFCKLEGGHTQRLSPWRFETMTRRGNTRPISGQLPRAANLGGSRWHVWLSSTYHLAHTIHVSHRSLLLPYYVTDMKRVAPQSGLPRKVRIIEGTVGKRVLKVYRRSC